MKLLRNKEVLKSFLLLILLSIIIIAIAMIFMPTFAVFAAVICVIFTTVHMITTYRRYKKIATLSNELDRILHGNKRPDFENYTEGELSILQNEIQKLLLRLDEQQNVLQKEKVHLADSIADISHQIKTPLTSINLLVSFLSAPDLDSEKRIKYTHELYTLLTRIEWLITALLKISRLDAGMITFKKESITVDELIKKSLETLLIPMELRCQTLTTDIKGNIICDKIWTSEAISNIVKNCMEHTPNGSELHISSNETALFTEIVISDTGSGIAEDDLPHIFDRFYKGKNSDDNSFGIGLALARMIIKNQDGTVKAENNADKGARFTIRIYKSTV